ncbi:DUF2007 domain-containing protein [Anaerosphaera multitolerans]|uniref:DUF2007 domain-containing protein n=1 Tax=Anaerosphaera multitolerans TaxID=2487351 RepID=A0A437S7I7_9FIRM|nr:DUF2007 domain-containing protein [Anaerosphaera multitolerans]RVU54807.1 hypothetical protein EF514_05665 [Anaerosphaera multitolerans]
MKDINIVPLITVNTEMEYNIIVGALDENEIPFFVKNYDIGSYMRIITGSTLYGAQILVEESDYEKAKELLITILGLEEFEK